MIAAIAHIVSEIFFKTGVWLPWFTYMHKNIKKLDKFTYSGEANQVRHSQQHEITRRRRTTIESEAIQCCCFFLPESYILWRRNLVDDTQSVCVILKVRWQGYRSLIITLITTCYIPVRFCNDGNRYCMVIWSGATVPDDDISKRALPWSSDNQETSIDAVAGRQWWWQASTVLVRRWSVAHATVYLWHMPAWENNHSST